MLTESSLLIPKEGNTPNLKAQGGTGELAVAIHRCPDFWLEDGDIVLQAEQTQFRVHRSILSRHSNVFRDMLNISEKSQKDSADDVYHVDGCPLVHLWDKAAEVQHIISIFYDGHKVHNWIEPMPLSHISILLRLGKKYEIDYLVTEALRRLRADHPTTLAGWEEIDIATYKATDGDHDRNFAGVINLAHEQSVPSILPAAYLRCILYGHELEEFLPMGSGLGLCAEAQHNCIIGHVSIINEAHFRFRQWRKCSNLLPAKGCPTPEVCMALQAKAIEEFPLWYCDNLSHIMFAPLKQKHLAGFCPKCAKAVRAKYNKTRGALWKELPSLFNLSDWEDLKDFDM